MALAKYYEDILERLNDNIDSVKLLSKEENRNFISDERWNQIIGDYKIFCVTTTTEQEFACE